MATVKISPIKRRVINPDLRDTIAGQLAKHGFNRVPGTRHMLTPKKEKDGSYRTGLNPEAPYIKAMNPEERETEIARINGYLEKISTERDMSTLGPRSAYYKSMWDEEMNGPSRARIVYMGSSDLTLDLNNVDDLITYAWLRVHPEIAPSYESFRAGLAGPHCKYYISEQEIETKQTFEEKANINKAIAIFEAMDNDKRIKVSRLMGLPVDERTDPKAVYNILDTEIKNGKIQVGKLRGAPSVKNFMKYAEMKDDNFYVHDLVKQAFSYSVLRMKNGIVMNGQNPLDVDGEEGLVTLLLSKKKEAQTLIMQLEQQIKTAKSVG